jgi:hypothetical protein
VWIWAAFRGQDGPNGAARVPVRPCFEHLRDFSDSFLTEFYEVQRIKFRAPTCSRPETGQATMIRQLRQLAPLDLD